MYIVIMAGGGGTRLWPKSREKKPKQLYALINEKSLIKNTVHRLLPLTSWEKLFIVTNKLHAKEIKKDIPKISPHLISEPAIRNTAPCISLSALFLRKKDKNAICAFLPSDHYIEKEKEFRRILKKAGEVAKKDYLVTIGIRPTDPETGLGYIKMGKPINNDTYEVERFVEKPNLKKAKEFLKSGQYLWNAGMFIGKADYLLSLFKKHLPKIYQSLMKIEKNPKLLKREYEKMENISMDYGIVEKTKKIAVLPAEIGWSDIGNWRTLLDILSKKLGENVVVGCKHIGVDTKGCLIHGTERLVATIGLKDIIVVDTPDVVFVCHKKDAQRVKEIIEKLKKGGGKEYL